MYLDMSTLQTLMRSVVQKLVLLIDETLKYKPKDKRIH